MASDRSYRSFASLNFPRIEVDSCTSNVQISPTHVIAEQQEQGHYDVQKLRRLAVVLSSRINRPGVEHTHDSKLYSGYRMETISQGVVAFEHTTCMLSEKLDGRSARKLGVKRWAAFTETRTNSHRTSPTQHREQLSPADDDQIIQARFTQLTPELSNIARSLDNRLTAARTSCDCPLMSSDTYEVVNTKRRSCFRHPPDHSTSPPAHRATRPHRDALDQVSSSV